MLPQKRMNTKMLLSLKGRMDSNGCLTFAIPLEETRKMDTSGEYLVTIEGPINETRTSYNRTVISL